MNGLCSNSWAEFKLLPVQSSRNHAAILWAWKALGASLMKDVMLECSICTSTQYFFRGQGKIMLVLTVLHGKGTGALGHAFSRT